MISVDNFYFVLYENLLKHCRFEPCYFYPFGTVGEENLCINFGYGLGAGVKYHSVLFYDQEPLLTSTLPYKLSNLTQTLRCKLLANSEHSKIKKNICKNENYLDWYYFYHGFASLYWLNDWKYLSAADDTFTKPFINLNRLVTNDRSYRLLLVSKLINENLINQGLVSLSLNDHGYGTWKDELKNSNTKLPKDQIDFIQNNISKIQNKSLIVDSDNPAGLLSAAAGSQDFLLNKKALWHVVSETNFYNDKLHLTEKIFKPIAAKRPFILVSSPGNLAYLKSYGFKSFSDWIDESYDNEYDDNTRLNLIVNEVSKLCNLSRQELIEMHKDMHYILEYNFKHFYGEFKNIIVNELVTNFQSAVIQWNNNRINDDHKINADTVDFDKLKLLLSQ